MNTIHLAISRTIVKNSGKYSHGSLSRLAGIVAVVGFLCLAYANFVAQRHYFNVVFIASRLESNISISNQTIKDYSSAALDMASTGECRSNLLGAGLTLLLADLDAESPKLTQDGRQALLRSVDRFLTHMLSCTPTDGDAWARLAMVRQALGERPSEEAALLERSSWFAPSEGSTLAARLEVWRHALGATLALAEPTVDRDILMALTYYSEQDAVRTLSGGGEAFQEHVISVSASLADDRVTSLRQAGLDFIPTRVSQGQLLKLDK